MSSVKTADALADNSATKLAAPAQGPTQEDIRKVVSEYQAREARRAAAQAKKTDEDKDKDKEKEKKGLLGSALEMGSKLISGGGSEEGTKSPSPAPASPASEMTGVPSSNVTTHNKYALHRHIFEARRNELRRKEMNKKAKETAQGLPQVPRGSF